MSTAYPVNRFLDQIEQLVRAFETASVAPYQFDHHAHMTVALWYLTWLPESEAADRMRTGLQHLAAAHGHHQLYNETITLFWLKLLRHFIDQTGPATPLPELTYQALTTLGSMRFVFSHYSREVVFSEAARRAWVAPDLLPLPFDDAL